MAWKCNKCQVEVEDVEDIRIIFNDAKLPDAKGYRCPSCSKEWIKGEYAKNYMAALEKMLEGK